MESKTVGVLGGGAWGTGLAQALARGGHKVSMWALEPEVKESVNNEHENKRYLPGYKLSPNLTVSLKLQLIRILLSLHHLLCFLQAQSERSQVCLILQRVNL